MSKHSLLIKRIFDVSFTFVLLSVFLWWILPLCALLIKISSKGPVFYKNYRYGKDFKMFIFYKFRSNLLYDSNLIDPYDRLFKQSLIGGFLRKTSLDEIPQFFHVLQGKMSLVGPRPHMINFSEEYRKLVDEESFNYRQTIKPGITGLSQIKGFKGNPESIYDIRGRYKLDCFYIKKRTLLFDVKILFMTIARIYKDIKG